MWLQSIRAKLIASYLVIALLTALSIYLLIRLTSIARLETLISEQQLSNIEQEIISWYEFEGGWTGFENYYYALHPRPQAFQPPEPPPDRQPPSSPPRLSGRLTGVLDANQQTLIQTFATAPGERFPDIHMSRAIPVRVDSEIVAYIVPDDERGIGLAAEEQIYLEQTNQVLLFASFMGVGLALLMGLGLTRVLVRPINDLTTATQAMADGELKQQVLIRSNDELGQLAETFNQMSSDLAEVTRQRKQMTADIAHDLGTPLQVISGYIEAIQDGTLAPSPERIKVIAVEIEHLRRLIMDLDLLAQTDTHSLRLQMEPIDPTTFLHQVAQSFTPLASAGGIQIVTHIPSKLPAIQADHERLLQVMGNLLSNALRYTPDGGNITIAAHQRLNQLILQVEDSGRGIDPSDLPYIFDRFYKVDSSRSEGGKMGLGLAISKALVEAMGGMITAESGGDQLGTTFRVAFQI